MMTRSLLASLAGAIAASTIFCSQFHLQADELPSRPTARSTADYINSVPSRRRQASRVQGADPVELEGVDQASHEVIYEDGYIPSEGYMPSEGPITMQPGGHESWIQDDCGSCGDCNSCGSICGWDLNFMPCGKVISHEAQIDYLLWWREGTPLPPLVTTGGTNGVLGSGQTNLFGGTEEQYDTQSGARISLGLWLDDNRRWNLGGRYWQLGESSIGFSASGDGSAGSTLIARPFFNADPGVNANDSELINEPDERSGSIDIASNSDVLGGDLLIRYLINCCGTSRLDFVTGYQFARYDESLSFNSTSTITATNLTRNVSESFDARNEFHGGIIGLKAQRQGGGWTLDVLGKIGLGNVDQTVTIAGATQNVDAGGGVTNVAGGLLAQPSNIGVFNQSQFAVVPELNVNLFYEISCNMRVGMGYSLIYFSEAVQPGNQLDLTVDPTQTNPSPGFAFDSSDFYVQGLNFGLQWDY
jgi:hypothetical protein